MSFSMPIVFVPYKFIFFKSGSSTFNIIDVDISAKLISPVTPLNKMVAAQVISENSFDIKDEIIKIFHNNKSEMIDSE